MIASREGLRRSMEKRLWVVTMQEIYEGYLYVSASNEEAARDLAWTSLGRGREPRAVGHGYLISAAAIGDPETLSETLEELSDTGPDVDEDDPAFAEREHVPEHWDP